MNKRLYFEYVSTINELMLLMFNDFSNVRYILNQPLEDGVIDSYARSMKSLSNTKNEKEFIKFVHYVDNKMNFGGQADQNRFHKIPTILSYANLLYNYGDKIKDYDIDEKLALANHMFYEKKEDFENININFPKILMDTITKKYKNYKDHLECLKFCSNNQNKMSIEDIIDYINKNDINNIVKKNIEFRDKFLDELGEKNESRRF